MSEVQFGPIDLPPRVHLPMVVRLLLFERAFAIAFPFYEWIVIRVLIGSELSLDGRRVVFAHSFLAVSADYSIAVTVIRVCTGCWYSTVPGSKSVNAFLVDW